MVTGVQTCALPLTHTHTHTHTGRAAIVSLLIEAGNAGAAGADGTQYTINGSIDLVSSFACV